MLHTVFWILILLHTVTVVFSKANSRRRREKISLLFFLKQKNLEGKLLHTVKSNKKTLGAERLEGGVGGRASIQAGF